MPDFFAHLKLAYQFATANIRQTKLGYYVATFEMALDQILNLTSADILEAGKACDAEEDEDEIASKFSAIERRIEPEVEVDLVDQSCTFAQEQDDETTSAEKRPHTQDMVQLPPNSNTIGATIVDS